MSQHTLFTRFVSLVRGSPRTSLRHAEARNPEAVYDDAILQRIQHYNHLREAVARLTCLRTRFDGCLPPSNRRLVSVKRALGRIEKKPEPHKGIQ